MNNFARSVLYVLTIVAVLMTSALGTTTVYAEDGPTADPPPEDPALSEPPTDDPAITEPPTEDPVITEPPTEDPLITEPAVEDPVITESPQIEETTPLSQEDQNPPEDPVTVPEILEQVPEDTNLVVVNDEGTAEPLASQEASDILKEGDPVWCPVGQAPGDSGCSGSHTSFNGLFVDLRDNGYSGDGVIWVESNYDRTQDTSEIVFDHTNGDLAQLDDLTIIGGWDGNDGSTTDPNNPSVLDDRLFITNWQSNVTIYNLEFDGAVVSGPSLQVRTEGNITLENVAVTGNTNGSGADLDNSDATCTTCPGISVKDSTFSNNDDIGLYMESKGDVTLTNVTAADNGDFGVYLETGNSDDNNVNFSDVEATGNLDDGIFITDVDGNITIKNSTSSDNGDNGLTISDTMGDITFSNVTTSDNSGDGIEVDDTVGRVSGSNITAINNGNDGVDIDNTNGKVILSSSTASNNGDNGFEIDYSDSDIKMYCVTASENDGDGINIDTNGYVKIRCSTVTNNLEDGVDVNLASTVKLESVTTTGNGDQDVEVDPGTTLIVKEVDCDEQKEKETTSVGGDKGPYTKLYCLPGEIKAALYDTYGDLVEFTNLCGYEAGVFDPDSGVYPKAIPGGGDDYIISLHNKVIESLPDLVPDTEHGLPGIYAQVLDELPYVLPKEFSYSSAFFTVVLDEGEYMDPLPEGSSLTIRFRVPDGLDDDEGLTILWWDGADWVDLGGEYSEDGYYFEVTTEEIGVFVLAIYDS